MRRAAVLILALSIAANASAAPAITAVSGPTVQGSTLLVSGTGLPTKTRSKLYMYADAQNGSVAPNSTFSTQTSFNEIQNIALVADANKRWGTASFRSNWNYTSTQRAATLRTNIVIPYGGKLLLMAWNKSDINYTTTDSDVVNGVTHTPGTTQNWKFLFRGWHDASNSDVSIKYPDIIFRHFSYNEGAGSTRVGNEFPTNSTTVGASLGFLTTTYERDMVLIKYPSSLGAADGEWYIYKNGTLVKSKTNQQMNDAGHVGLPEQWYWQHVIANKNVPTGTNVWVSEYVVDEGWGRYELCNDSTYASASHCELQPFTSISATGATLNLHLGTFSSVAGLSLIAVDNNNVASPGYSMGGALSDPPPHIVSLSPTTSAAAGAATITMTATGLTATPSVKVGGIDATGENWISATQMTFVTPAGTAGSDASVLVQNPDGQNDTLSPGIHYDPAPLADNRVLPWAAPF